MIREDLANLWYQAIFSRYSVRAYERKTVPRDFREEIESLLNGFSPMCNGARAVLLEDGAEEILVDSGAFSARYAELTCCWC